MSWIMMAKGVNDNRDRRFYVLAEARAAIKNFLLEKPNRA